MKHWRSLSASFGVRNFVLVQQPFYRPLAPPISLHLSLSAITLSANPSEMRLWDAQARNRLDRSSLTEIRENIASMHPFTPNHTANTSLTTIILLVLPLTTTLAQF